MMARGFKSVGWVAGIAAAALGCYILSLNVAAERAELSGVERRILETRQAIRNLEIELSTRGRMTQLEQWNADVLALSAPVSGQFVENEVVLARLEVRDRGLGDAGELRMASAQAAPARAAPPAPRPAVAATPAQPRPAPADPVVRRASLESDPTRPAANGRPAPPSAAAPVRTASLLDDRTTRAIGAAAQAEAARPEQRSEPGERSERPSGQ